MSPASSQVDQQINALGTNTLIVSSGDCRFGGRSGGAGSDRPLAEADLVAIRDKVPGIVAISGQLNGSGPVVYGSANWTTNLSGIHADFTTVRDWPVTSGRELTPGDIRSSAKVALIGATVAKELFGETDPVAAIVRIKNVPFQVIGVLAAKGQSGVGRDQDDTVLMPMTTARGRVVGRSQVQNDQIGSIHVKIDPQISLAEAQEEIEGLMRQRRPALAGGEDSFRCATWRNS